MNNELHITEGQAGADCPNCGKPITWDDSGGKDALIKGDEVRIEKPWIVPDPRPKCPHCRVRLNITFHLANR